MTPSINENRPGNPCEYESELDTDLGLLRIPSRTKTVQGQAMRQNNLPPVSYFQQSNVTSKVELNKAIKLKQGIVVTTDTNLRGKLASKRPVLNSRGDFIKRSVVGQPAELMKVSMQKMGGDFVS